MLSCLVCAGCVGEGFVLVALSEGKGSGLDLVRDLSTSVVSTKVLSWLYCCFGCHPTLLTRPFGIHHSCAALAVRVNRFRPKRLTENNERVRLPALTV